MSPVYKHRSASTGRSAVGVIVSGTWAGTVQIQLSDPDRSAWVGLEDWTANGAKVIDLLFDCDLRVLFVSRTSGTAVASIIGSA